MKIARTGDSVELALGDERTIQEIPVITQYPAIIMRGRGRTLIHVRFMDGSSALLLSSLP